MRIVPVYPLVAAALALTSVARADAPAEAILNAIDQRSGQLTAFAGTLRVKRDMENVTIQLKFLRQPERFRLSIDDPRMGKVTFLNDGKASYMQGPDGSFLPAPAELIPIKQIWPNLGGTLSEFVGGIESSKVLPSEAPAPGKPERRVVELVGKERTTRLFVNDDNQIEYVRVMGTPSSEIALENPSYNPTLEASLFELPKDAKIVSQPEARTLTVGSLAPGFTLKTPAGASVSLARLAAGKKATLINFWATWCGPCREEMPALKKLHARLSPKGFQLISVNNAEDATIVKKFVAQEGFRFPVLLSSPSVLADYGVSAIPTNVLIDGKGKIVFASQGFDEAGLNAALIKLGLK